MKLKFTQRNKNKDCRSNRNKSKVLDETEKLHEPGD